MKIYQMLHFPLRGAGTGVYVDNLSAFLAERGHTVKTLCCDHYLSEKPYLVETILFKNSNNEKFDLNFDFPVLASHPLSQGTTFDKLSEKQKQDYFQIFSTKIERELSLFKPDIIHVYHGWIIASILARFNVPYIVSLHGTEYHAFKKYRDYQELVVQGLRRAQLVIALTNDEKEQAIQTYGIQPDKIVILPLAVRTDVFRPLPVPRENLLKHYSITETKQPVVFFGGRLTAQKGVDVLITAAKWYSHHHLKPLTLIAGDGDLKAELMHLSETLALENVYFLGNLDHQHIIALYNVADVVVMPSTFEPLPLAAMEALACGTPVIASNVGGLRQIVDEQVGYLVEPGDYVALAEKIISVIESGFKERVRAKAINRIKQNFDFDEIASRKEALYRSVIGARELF